MGRRREKHNHQQTIGSSLRGRWKKPYNKSDFTSGENNLILNKLERWRHKLRQWPKNVDNNKTLEELLNKAYNKEERDEINKRIAYLWENQDKTTMIYDIMVKSFGISGKEKYNSEKLSSRERNLLDSKLSNWASKIQRINFWPLKKGENKNKKHMMANISGNYYK